MPDSNRGAAISMPKLGQSMEAATIVQWHADEGSQVAQGQVVVTVETDKASYELEAPADGPLHILVHENEEVDVGTVIGSVGEVDVESAATEPAEQPPASPASQAAPAARPGRVLASPRAKRLAAEHNIDLSTVTPTSPDGMISADDVERARSAEPASAPAPEGRRVRERQRLTGIKRTTARRVLEAWQSIPHIVQMVDVDASGLLAERERLRERQVEASINDILLHAAARTMQGHPELNATVEDESLVFYEGVDVGVAVDTPRGLLVPVIRNAGELDVGQLAAEARRLATAARDQGLREEEFGQASLTVSNLGAFGIRAGTPIINLGEPVLVFVGAIQDRPVAVNGAMEIRPIMELSIAYDHRVADGVQAAAFTRDLKQALESLPSADSAAAAAPEEEDLAPRELRSTSGGEGLHVALRAHGGYQVDLDEPEDHGGTGRGPTPVEALLAGLLGCMTISFKAAARRRNVPVDRVDGHVKANERRHLSQVSLELEVWTQAEESEVRGLLEAAERGCFVSGVLKPDLDYQVDVKIRRD